MSLQIFTEEYIETARWCGALPPYKIAEKTRGQLEKDAMAFYCIMRPYFDTGEAELDAWNAGHDFWLTRNGHITKFWDGYWSEPQVSYLTEASKAAGPCDLYVGDDGLLHIVT